MAHSPSTNARWLIASKIATGLGDLLCSAKTTVPWLMLSAGIPAGFLGLLVPVRESGSMLPQVAIAPWVQRVSPRKRVSMLASIGQAVAAIAIAVAATTLRGALAGVAVVAALAVLALCRAFASLANKDVLARAVPKGERGKVGGRATSLAGLLGLAGAAATLLSARPESAALLAMVVGASAITFVLSALLLTRVTERDETSKTKARPSLRDAIADSRLRRFVLVRLLLAGSALGGPFIVALGRESTSSLQTLSAFVLAGGAASFVSAGAWGRLADNTGRGCMAAGGAVASASALGVLILDTLAPHPPAWTWAALYFAFNLGYVGVRVGRKTYVVDLAQGPERTQFVASSNTLVALALLAAGVAMTTISNPTTALTLCLAATTAGTLTCTALEHRPA